MPVTLADASAREVCVSLTTEWRVWEDGERATVDVSVLVRLYAGDPDAADVEVLEVLDALGKRCMGAGDFERYGADRDAFHEAAVAQARRIICQVAHGDRRQPV